VIFALEWTTLNGVLNGKITLADVGAIVASMAAAVGGIVSVVLALRGKP
jgi:hypothetical protein